MGQVSGVSSGDFRNGHSASIIRTCLLGWDIRRNILDIIWFGRACFRISERSHPSVVTDPYEPERGLPELTLRADLVTISHDTSAHRVQQVRDHYYVISSPGEYEVGDLFVTGIPLHIHDEEHDQILDNIAYLFEYPNQLKVMHFGNLHQVPDQSIIEQLDEVHVLLLPLDGKAGLPGEQMAEVISLIEPNYVVPMNYNGGRADADSSPLDGFLTAMGVGQLEAQDSLRVTSNGLPEQTQVVLLRTNFPSN